jgi:hypothetical protein
MRAYTDQDVLFGAAALPGNGDTSSVLEPATGAVSLDGHKYEDIIAMVSGLSGVAGAQSASVQFYEADAASGDVSASWDAVGDPIVVDLGALTAGSAGKAVMNRQNFTKKYVSAIATITHPDPLGDGVTAYTLTLVGHIVDRVG